MAAAGAARWSLGHWAFRQGTAGAEVALGLALDGNLQVGGTPGPVLGGRGPSGCSARARPSENVLEAPSTPVQTRLGRAAGCPSAPFVVVFYSFKKSSVLGTELRCLGVAGTKPGRGEDGGRRGLLVPEAPVLGPRGGRASWWKGRGRPPSSWRVGRHREGQGRRTTSPLDFRDSGATSRPHPGRGLQAGPGSGCGCWNSILFLLSYFLFV